MAGSVATMVGSAQTARNASTQVLTLATNLSNQAERLQGEVARAVGSIRAA